MSRSFFLFLLGTNTLQEILRDKEIIAHHIQVFKVLFKKNYLTENLFSYILQKEFLDDVTETWGIQVERVEIKDVRLPVQMQRAMATEAEATREARAKVIAAEGEQKASVALKEAADMIDQSPVALQLRYLQTITSISSEKNSTIIFPTPIEMLKSFAPTKK